MTGLQIAPHTVEREGTWLVFAADAGDRAYLQYPAGLRRR